MATFAWTFWFLFVVWTCYRGTKIVWSSLTRSRNFDLRIALWTTALFMVSWIILGVLLIPLGVVSCLLR